MSWKLIPIAVCLIRTSPCAGSGNSSFSILSTSGPPVEWMRMAFMGISVAFENAQGAVTAGPAFCVAIPKAVMFRSVRLPVFEAIAHHQTGRCVLCSADVSLSGTSRDLCWMAMDQARA